MNKYYLQDLSTLIDVSFFVLPLYDQVFVLSSIIQPLIACPLSAVIWVTTSPYPRCSVFT